MNLSVGVDDKIVVCERLIHPVVRFDKEDNWLALGLCVMSRHYSVSRSLRRFGLITASEYRAEKTKEDDASLYSWSEWCRYQRRKKGKK